MIIGVVYRHPTSGSLNELFFKSLKKTLKLIKKEGKKAIICGDFNFNLLNFDSDNSVNFFLNCMLEHGFQPCILQPTRITNTCRPSLLDNIFLNGFDNPISGNILEHISYDHLPNFSILNHENRRQVITKMKRDIEKLDIGKFQQDLLDSDFLVKLLNSDCTESAYTFFHQKYLYLLDKHAPLRRLTKKENKLQQTPWMTKGILKSISKKRKLFKKFKGLKLKDKDATDIYRKYKEYNDLINKLIKRCKRDYYQQYFSRHSKNSKLMWNGINRLLKRSRKKQGMIYLEEDNKRLSDPLKIANKFNNYFLNVANSLCSKIPKVNTKFQDYLKINENRPLFAMHETTPDEIVKVISDLDIKKSKDIYHISPELVKISSICPSEKATSLLL